MNECYVYLIGHEHATFGTAVKVGIASNVDARLATFQTANIEKLQLYFRLRFATREEALKVERLFHDSCLAGPVRGEWCGCDPVEALFFLVTFAAKVLSQRYSGEELRLARLQCGLLDAFEKTDKVSSEQQEEWNEDLCIALSEIEERGYL